MCRQLGLEARQLDTVLAGEQREQGRDLQVSDARQLREPRAQVGAALRLLPDARAVTVVALVEERAERTHACRHRAGEAVQRRSLAEDRDEVLGILGGDAPRVEVPETPLQLERAGECLLHRHLLVEAEADQQGVRVLREQPVGLVVTGEGQPLGPGASVTCHGLSLSCAGGFRSIFARASSEAVHAPRGERSAAAARSDRDAHARGRTAAARGGRGRSRRSGAGSISRAAAGPTRARPMRSASSASRPRSCARRSTSSRGSACR